MTTAATQTPTTARIRPTSTVDAGTYEDFKRYALQVMVIVSCSRCRRTQVVEIPNGAWKTMDDRSTYESSTHFVAYCCNFNSDGAWWTVLWRNRQRNRRRREAKRLGKRKNWAAELAMLTTLRLDL